jgi:hypothetical protein
VGVWLPIGERGAAADAQLIWLQRVQGCRVYSRSPSKAHLGKLKTIDTVGGKEEVGCMYGAVVGGVFSVASTAGLDLAEGTIAGCAIGVGVIDIFE